MKKILFTFLLLVLAGSAFAQGYVSSTRADVSIQDQHTRALDARFVTVVGAPTTLRDDTIVDSQTITLFDATGFVDGTYVGVTSNDGRFMFATQLGAAAANVITLDSPVDQVYLAGSTVLNTSYDMAVDGSGVAKVFQIGPIGQDIEVDITRILGYMVDTESMDDSEFGSLTALTNGCVLRQSNGTEQNIWNVKTNGDLALLGYDLTYPSKPPAGKNSMRFRITYAGQDKHGVTIRLEASDILEFIIQDNLTGLEVFNMMAQGHIVE